MDEFKNRLISLLDFARNKGQDEYEEVKRAVNRFFYELSTEGGFPANFNSENISPETKQRVDAFLQYLLSKEDDMIDDLEAYSRTLIDTLEIAGGKRKRKTRKHSKRRKHTRKHYRPRGKKL